MKRQRWVTSWSPLLWKWSRKRTRDCVYWDVKWLLGTSVQTTETWSPKFYYFMSVSLFKLWVKSFLK